MYEKLDIYNENRIKTGRIIERKEGEILDEDEYLLAVQCWIINAEGQILLTKRRLDKKDGGMWEATSGLVQSGENSIQGIKRELEEEIGVTVEDKDLKLFKSSKSKTALRDIYVINKDISMNELKFNDGEVIDAKYVDIKTFKNMIDNGECFEWSRWFLEDYNKMKKM